MELIVDLHIHSHYSRATSREMNIESLYWWGKVKGINIIGTGDFTHPAWFGELKNKLEPAEPGLFKLKDEYAKRQDGKLPESVRSNLIRFILTVEISNIYKRHEKTRKLHNLIISPSFSAAGKIINELDRIGNIKSDGRPILGLDSYELLKISLNSDPDNLFIPAHIWTPWFSMFGSKSGFDTIEEAFGDLSSKIVAVETGLSSDPFMNWRLKQLDSLTLVSNSDAHSPRKLGREANLINCKIDYKDIIGAIKNNDERFVGTIEFFPQEGKYHWDGHRKCNIFMSPGEAKKLNNKCPVCKKELVLGVDHRVEELASRGENYKPKKHKVVSYIVPLAEIIAEVNNVKSTTSKTVEGEYQRMIVGLGDEFGILRKASFSEIEKVSNKKTAEAVKKMREKNIYIRPGYDGVFGLVKIFNPEKRDDDIQMGLL
jgi:DNA helicase-2/ATP-dependent DNA helicase PcrA